MNIEGNRRAWLNVDDYVIIDAKWFLERPYRLRKNHNDVVYDDMCKEGLLRIVFVAPQGQSFHLVKTYESCRKWQRNRPIKIQLSHHSFKHPVIFSSRRVT